MASPGYFGDGPPMRERDPYFTEVISKKMRVPERLRVGPTTQTAEPVDPRPADDLPAAYSMHIPDRLALTGNRCLCENALACVNVELYTHRFGIFKGPFISEYRIRFLKDHITLKL